MILSPPNLTPIFYYTTTVNNLELDRVNLTPQFLEPCPLDPLPLKLPSGIPFYNAGLSTMIWPASGSSPALNST